MMLGGTLDAKVLVASVARGAAGGSGAWVTWPGVRVPCLVGRGGIVPGLAKREGDGATPAGLLALRRVLYRADRLARPPGGVLPRGPLAPRDGWCDDPASADYNRPITLPHSARHEVLWRDDAVYDVIGVLGWNDDPVERGRGSAIFLHVARPDGVPTEGCVAMARDHLLALLAAGIAALSIAAD